jgi:hypothetical protein
VTTTTTTTYAEQAAAIRAVARDATVAVSAGSDGVVTAEARFPAGDRTAYVVAEAACQEVLRLFKQTRGGSVWGTDSASVGGMAGLAGGYCRLHKSGIPASLARQFLGADPELELAVQRAEAKRTVERHAATLAAKRDATDERAAGMTQDALRLRDALAELGADEDDDHLAHLGGLVIDAAFELGEAWRYGVGNADELEADMRSLTARVRRLLAVR